MNVSSVPVALPRDPHRHLLPAGTLLWRLHPKSAEAGEFTRFGKARRLTSGRFDACPADPYDSFFAGLDASALLVNVLLRGMPCTDQRFRTVRRARVTGMRLSAIATTEELSLVSLLDTPALTAVGQDRALIAAGEQHQGRIGDWVAALRAKAPSAQGLVWPAEHDHTEQLVVLFGDRVSSAMLAPEPDFAVDLDEADGATVLNSMLAPHRARVMPPR